MKGLCVGSGQKPYDRTKGWINLDAQEKWTPDIVRDWNDLSCFADGEFDCVVAEQTIEHVGCGEADGFLKEANRILKVGGSLIITVPDMRALAQRWLLGLIPDYIFAVNTYGAYMSDEHDRHRWMHTPTSLHESLTKTGVWATIKPYDLRAIEGAPIAWDWWILGIEAVK